MKKIKLILSEYKQALLFVGALICLAAGGYRHLVVGKLTLNGHVLDGVSTDLDIASTSKVPTVDAVRDWVNGRFGEVENSEGNVLQAISLWDYSGFVANAVVGAGNYATGTDATPYLQQAINDAASYQLIVVPPGAIFKTALDTIKSTKVLNVIFLGNHYQAGNDLFILHNPGGPYEPHKIVHMGDAINKINMPTNSSVNYANGVLSATYAAMTGTFVKIYNTSQIWIEMNYAAGFKVPVEIISAGGGFNGGSQENVVKGRKFDLNAYGALLTSTDGGGYNDKNRYEVERIGAGTAIKMDGYSGSYAGEVYNGTMTSNNFNAMIERVIHVIDAKGNVEYTHFNITTESGTITGVWSDTAYDMRNTFPNPVRSSLIAGQGIMEIKHIEPPNSFGLNGKILKTIWKGGDKYCEEAIIGPTGLVLCKALPSLGKWIRDAAPSNVRFIKADIIEAEVTVTTQNYTIPLDTVRYIIYDYAGSGGTISTTAANTSNNRLVTIFNNSASSVTISGLGSLAAGGVQTIFCNGSSWRKYQ